MRKEWKRIVQLVFALAIGTALAACGGGKFTDPRDGHTYKSIKIGQDIWLAENLAFEHKSSEFPGKEKDNAALYGRLYPSYALKEICPKGWHLPSRFEFEKLLTAACGDPVACSLKELSKIGFNPQRAGSDEFVDFGLNGYIWTASDKGRYNYVLAFVGPFATLNAGSGASDFSVRCVKDKE